MTSILIISFSDITQDARVLKQVTEFSRDYEVTTCGYGPIPPGATHHVSIPRDRISWAYSRADLILHFYQRAYWTNPAVSYATRELRGRRFDIVLANDLDTVPLALASRPRLGVHADLHEYAPREREDLLRWRVFVAPFRRWLCRTYLPKCASITTVGQGLAAEYTREFGVEVGVVMNATPAQDLPVTPVGDPIRLVHSGACLRARVLEVMLEAVERSTIPVTIDLYVTPNDPGYLAELRERFGDSERIQIHDPVPYEELVVTLNAYDVGVFVLPPTTFSYHWALPNKLFDYVQARLGVITGPSPEMARIVREYGLGDVTDDFCADSLVTVLDSLTPEQVETWKLHSAQAADALAAPAQVAIWRGYIDAIGSRR